MPETKYIRALYARARERGLDSDGLHEIVLDRFGAESIKTLSNKQAAALLNGFGKSRASSAARRHAQSHHGRKNYDPSGEPIQLASDREREMLREAGERRGWNDDTLRGFIRRQTGRDDVRTMADFNKVFWPLKAMNRRDGR